MAQKSTSEHRTGLIGSQLHQINNLTIEFEPYYRPYKIDSRLKRCPSLFPCSDDTGKYPQVKQQGRVSARGSALGCPLPQLSNCFRSSLNAHRVVLTKFEHMNGTMYFQCFNNLLPFIDISELNFDKLRPKRMPLF